MAEMRTIRELHNLAAGRPVFVVGTGPSVANFDWGRLKGQFAIALNDAIAFPFVPDCFLFNDCQGDHPLQFVYVSMSFAPTTKIICQETGWKFFSLNQRWKYLDQTYTYHQRGPDVEPGQLWVNQTVSTAAIQLAIWMGASAIYLLGIDGYRQGIAEYAFGVKSPDDERTTILRRTQDDSDYERMKRWIDATGIMPAGGIINLSKHSIIRTWAKRSAEEVLQESSIAQTP